MEKTIEQMEKSVDQTLLDRRSIRRYEREHIAEEDLDFIRRTIQNTPTSYNGQQFSVVEVSDQPLKEQLAAVIGQKQVKTSDVMYFFCSDYNKISVAARAKNLEMPPFDQTADGLIVGIIDAALAMMGAIVAAESCGLGTCPIGYARTVNPTEISRMLGLPDRVAVVCGLTVGIPREMPDMKPKQPIDTMVFKNRYGVADMAAQLLEYDKEIQQYNRSRAGGTSDNDWIAHILGYYREGMHYRMLEALRQRGYMLQPN